LRKKSKKEASIRQADKKGARKPRTYKGKNSYESKTLFQSKTNGKRPKEKKIVSRESKPSPQRHVWGGLKKKKDWG